MDNELELVVQRMVEAGEPEDNIALVIQQWPKKDQEVDSQGSAPTSQTSGTPSGSSEEPSLAGSGEILVGEGDTTYATVPDVIQMVDAPQDEQNLTPDRNSVLSDAYNSLLAGSAQLGAGLAGIPEFLYEVFALPQNIAADITGYEGLRADFDNIAQGEYNPLKAVSDLSKYYGTLSEDASAQVTKFDQDILGSITSGDLGGAGRQLLNNMVGSVPSMLAMATTSGASTAANIGTLGRHALTALPFASGYLQEIENNPNVNDTYKPVIAALNGLSEIVFEESFGSTALIRDIVAEKIGREGVKQFAEGFLGKALSSQGIPAALVRGGASEGATQLAQNIIDKYSGIDPDRDLMQGVTDAVITGAVMDGGIRTVNSISNAVVGSNKTQAEQLEAEIKQQQQDLNNPEVSVEAKDLISESVEAKTEQLSGLIDESREQLSNLPTGQLGEVEALIKRQEQLQEVVNDPNVSEQTKSAFTEELQTISTEIDNLITQGEQANAIQEREAETVPVVERTEGSQEVDGEVREQAETEEVQTQTQEVTPREVSEVDRTVFGQAATPEQNITANRASYERLTEGMTPEQIDADPDLVRMREQIEGTTEGAQTDVQVSDQAVQESPQFMNREQTETVNTEEPAIVTVEGNEITLPTPTQERLQRIQSRREDIRQRLRAKLGTMSSGVNPEVFGDLVELGATYIEEGIVRFGEFARRLREDYGRNLTDREAREIYNESATSLGYRVRGFVKSAETSPDISTETKLEIEENVAPLYQAQVISELTEEVSQLTEAEKVAEVQRLSNVTGELNKDNNRAVLAGIDLINQYEAEGRHEEAAAIIDSMAKSATVMGQLIRQYGEFKSSTPAGFLHIVERWVNEVGRELTARNRERLAELYSEYQVAANALQQAQQTLSDNFSQANRKAVMSAEIALENAQRNLSDYIIDIKGKDTGSVLVQILQGNLLTFKSLVINPFANAVELGVRLSRESLSSLLDMAASAVVGTPRVKTFPLSPETLRLSGRAAVEGFNRALRKSVHGSDATELSKYDITARLTPFKAMKRLINSYKLQDFKDEFTYTGWDRFNDVLEATIGIPANTALRGLPFGDDPFYQQARVSKLIQIAKREKGLRGQDVESFVYSPDAESAEIADTFGRAATFQDKTWLASNVRNLMSNAEGAVNRFLGGGRVANSVAKLFSRATIPFINTPSSILMKTLRFAVPFFPAANAVKAVYDIKKLANGKLPLEEKRKRMPALRERLYDSVAETTISFAMVYFAKTLVMEGLVSGDSPDEPERAKERQFMYNTMPPNTINISGFNRWATGGDSAFQPGDRVISYIPFGIPGALIGIVERTQGNKLREKRKQERELTSAGEPLPVDDTGVMDFFGEYTANLPASLQYFMNQSFVQSAGALFQTLSETDGRAFGTQMVRTLSNLGIPNSVSQALRAGNDYMRIVYTNDMVETWANIVAEKAGAVDDLPVRYDLWGRPVPQSPSGTNPYFFQMVDIFRTQKIVEDELTYKVFDLYTKTKDTSAIPSNIRDYYKQGDFTVRLTPEEKSELSRIVGEQRAKYAERAMRGYTKDTAKPELYVKKLAKAYQQGATQGKKIFKRELMLRNREQ